MSWMDTPDLEQLGHFLDLASYRQGLIAGNLANIDTPGYQTRDIRFADEMQKAAGSEPVPQTVPGLIERPDGNNVSVDRETMLLAQNQLQFRIGVELVRIELHRLLTAITEGRS